MDPIVDEGIKTYINYITPWIMVIGSLIIALYGLWTRGINKRVTDIEDSIEKEEEARLKRDEEAEEHCRKCKANIMDAIKEANREMVATFQEGLKNERLFRIEVMKEQGANIKQIYERLDEISVSIAEIGTIIDAHIKYQKEICDLRHKDN